MQEEVKAVWGRACAEPGALLLPRLPRALVCLLLRKAVPSSSPDVQPPAPLRGQGAVRGLLPLQGLGSAALSSQALREGCIWSGYRMHALQLPCRGQAW